jgi:hypothetical protein
MRNSIAVAAIVAAVAALLLGGWFLLNSPGSTSAGGPAPTTLLVLPSGSTRPAYPTVPPEQVRLVTDDGYAPLDVRTTNDGRQLLIPMHDLECFTEEARLLAEHPDRVEVEIRALAKPPPPGTTLDANGSYICASFEYNGLEQGPHAAVDLAAPLGARSVVIHRKSG